MKTVSKRRIVWMGVMILCSSFVGAATLEERMTALEERFEKEASAREEVLLARIGELEKQVQVMSEQIATAKPQEVSPEAGDSLGTRMSAVENEVAEMKDTQEKEFQLLSPLKGLTLGGYGELHYNELNGSGGASDKSEIDLHRFVLTVGKEFNEQVRFFSELEVEHGSTENQEGDDGYVVVEQAYVDFDLNEQHTARGGVFLMPVGLLNQNHEPTRFYGVERNSVENQILPTTWFEPGAGLHGLLSETLRYDAYVHSGLDTSAKDKYSIRSGRQKGSYADSSQPAGTMALNWTLPGVTVGGSSQYQQDITAGDEPSEVSAMLGELHMDLQWRKWGFRTLYAHWELDGAGPEAIGADRQSGWYLEPSYKLTEKVGLFTRYSQWNNQAGSQASDTGKEQANIGVNWYPHPQVVLKADYQWQFNENEKNQDGVNAGLGYEF